MESTSDVEGTAVAATGTDGRIGRRAALGRGAKMAFAAPAIIAVLQARTAFADDDDETQERRRRNDENRERRGRGNDDGDSSEHSSSSSTALRQQHRRTAFRSDLCRVSEVAAGDFVATNPGTDPLERGSVRVIATKDETRDGRVLVRLRGAAANATYTVAFVRFADRGREVVGTVTTDAQGKADAFAHDAATGQAGMLAGTRRVGVFVVTRSVGGVEQDQFVSCVHTDRE